MSKFDKLFEPIRIGPVTVPNRIAMFPTNENMARPDGTASTEQIGYWAIKAKGGAGLVIAGNAAVDHELSRITSTQLTLGGDAVVPYLKNLAEAIHMYGAKTVMEIVHAGRQAMVPVIGTTPVAPSPIQARNRVVPRELTIPEIEGIVERFSAAAARVKKSDFDGVEVHCAYGYLLSQFISPFTNKRTDKYGGSLENRMRLPLEVVEAVRQRVGDDFVVGVRFNANDYAEGGVTPEVAREEAKMFEAAGVDYLAVGSGHASESVYMTEQPIYIPRGETSYLAGEIKREVNVPIMTSGSLDENIALRLLNTGQVDIIGMARPLIADPYFPTKLRDGREKDIRRCIRCNECIGRILDFGHIRCSVNPDCGSEDPERNRYELTRAEKPKKVLVAGGGPAGLEFAQIAALRRHKVFLYEKSKSLGGLLNISCIPSFKQDIALYRDYMINQAKKLGVKIQLGKEVTPRVVRTVRPDVLVVAVGAQPIIPKLPGIDGKNVCTAVEALKGDVKLGEKIVVVGAGLVGCETAMHLTEKGKSVTLVEMLEQIAYDVDMVTRACLTDLLRLKKIETRTGEKLEEVTTSAAVVADRAGRRAQIAADNVVLAVGFEPNTDLVDSLRGLVRETHVVGDALEARKIFHAVHEGFHAARQI